MQIESKRYAKVVATGGYVPAKVLSNQDLSKMVDTSDEWIVERTGIHTRHLIAEGESVAEMAVRAAQDCLQATRAELKNENAKPDLILVATCSHPYAFPSVACQVQAALHLAPAETPGFDLSAACSGFVYALEVADQYIKTGKASSVLVIGVDALSRFIDWTDRATCVLFGDGAGAAYLALSAQPGVLQTVLRADGDRAELLRAGTLGQTKLQMKGNATFKVAVTKLSAVVDELIQKSGVRKEEIRWLVPHQANLRIIDATAKRLGLPLESVILTLDKQGNTSAASVPLALNHGVKSGQIQRGDLLLLDAFGGGMTWGAALIRY